MDISKNPNFATMLCCLRLDLLDFEFLEIAHVYSFCNNINFDLKLVFDLIVYQEFFVAQEREI